MEPVYVGIKGRIFCIDRRTGATLWETHLASRGFVNVMRDGDEVIAATYGEVFCLDAKTGGVKWKNGLPGMGRGLITIAGSPGNLAAIEQNHADAAAAAAAAS